MPEPGRSVRSCDGQHSQHSPHSRKLIGIRKCTKMRVQVNDSIGGKRLKRIRKHA